MISVLLLMVLVLWNEVLLVGCLVMTVVRVLLTWRWSRSKRINLLGIKCFDLLIRSRHSCLHHSAVVVAFICGCWITVELVLVRVLLWAVKRFLVSCSCVLILRLLLGHHEVLNCAVWVSLNQMLNLLRVVLSVRFTLCLRNTATAFRAGAHSLFLRLLSVSSILWA